MTWGQFFVYQGFNEHCGWMHTSSQADSMDEYLETLRSRMASFTTNTTASGAPVTRRRCRCPTKTGNEQPRKEFTTYRTHHGPVVGQKRHSGWR